MKQVTKTLLFASIVLIASILVTSCNLCENVVCTNGYCSNGICLCNDGYEKVNGACIGINNRYVGEDLYGIQIKEDSSAGPPDTQTVVYTIIASDIDPTKVILKDFINLANHNITFTVNPLNRNEFIETETITTAPTPILYKVSGSKDDHQIELTIQEATTIIDSSNIPPPPIYHITLWK